ncbi:DnaJ C-terminal domain-containing protein [Rhodovarius sp.]|jgi:DnaJ-class molecular chaperone|uniref:DnaJ C-terminal domain-containing protein n=1 Tax=Rhodovarius sp. TaxID=2972673 RepID=UPI0034A38541
MALDPYAVLGLKRDASAEAIKSAYRKLARKHHPDLNPGKPEAEARFKAVSTAHDLLSDPEKRARFDRGEIDAEGQEQRPTNAYRRHAEAAQGARYDGQSAGSPFDDLFADMFEARRRAEAAPRPGQDESYRLDVSFIDAMLGTTTPMRLPDGRSLNLRIPPGVTTGQVLRLRGQGGGGRNGGAAGDALIGITVQEHPLLRRDGRNIAMELPVSLREAVLGGPVEVPTPTGRLRVTLPAHSDSGRQIRLRGKGVAAHGAEPAGDLLLTLKVVIGPADAALDAFLQAWSPAAMEDPRAALDFPA